jgi:hypothetical protein
VSGRPTRAWALSTENETPPCSDQPKERTAVHANTEIEMADLLTRFIGFSPLRKDPHGIIPACGLRLLDPDQGIEELSGMLITLA